MPASSRTPRSSRACAPATRSTTPRRSGRSSASAGSRRWTRRSSSRTGTATASRRRSTPRSPEAVWRFRSRVCSGMVSVNNSTSGAEAHLPFGGNGRSGNGSRQSGVWVLDQFTRWQAVNWDWSGQAAEGADGRRRTAVGPGLPAVSTLPERASVVVVGGGVVGCSTAFHLAEAGVDVLLVERDSLGSGSSSKAAGGVRACFSDPLNVRLGKRSLDLLADIGQRPGGEIDLRRCRLPVPAHHRGAGGGVRHRRRDAQLARRDRSARRHPLRHTRSRRWPRSTTSSPAAGRPTTARARPRRSSRRTPAVRADSARGWSTGAEVVGADVMGGEVRALEITRGGVDIAGRDRHGGGRRRRVVRRRRFPARGRPAGASRCAARSSSPVPCPAYRRRSR